MGKSGYVARKIAATFSSIGMPAVFLHPAEAFHGDLGVYRPGDASIVISKSGATAELVPLVSTLRQLGSKLIAICGNSRAPVLTQFDAVLDASVDCEADEHKLVPTCSTTVALALGDALAVTLMKVKGFGAEQFARRHPGGQLGRSLLLQVKDVMETVDRIATATRETVLKDVVIAMTRYPLGAACVLDIDNKLVGLITDGDLRRALQHWDDIRDLKAEHIMTSGPVSIAPEATLQRAAAAMEQRSSQISVLPVVTADGSCVGLLRLHDLYRHNAAL